MLEEGHDTELSDATINADMKREISMRDRWFESISLQRGVSCEPDFLGFDRPTRRRERQMKRFKSAGQARFLSVHDQINNLFNLRRDHVTAAAHRASRTRLHCH